MYMAKEFDKFGKFVRLNLVREIVEVVSVDPTEITVKYYGMNIPMQHHEVSLVTPEEAAAVAFRVSRDRFSKHATSVGEWPIEPMTVGRIPLF
jgi:hypothetical protein